MGVLGWMRKILPLLLVATLMLCCAQSLNVTKVTPKEVMGMRKVVCIKGKAALELVQMMHIGKIRYVKDIAMMHYFSPNMSKYVTLWVTLYPNSSIAKKETEMMAKAMVKYGWTNITVKRIDGLRVYVVTPPNSSKLEYFWCKDMFMLYLIPHNMSGREVKMFIEKISRCV